MSLNKVLLLGHLGQDPDLKFLNGGNAVLNLRLATSEVYLDKQNVKQEKTDWHTVTVWGKRAEALAKILVKGSQILVEGRLQTRSYDKNGEKRYATDVVATNIHLAGGKRSDANGSSNASHGASEPDNYGPDDGPGSDEMPF